MWWNNSAEEYLVVSFLVLIISTWNQLYLLDESLGNFILFLVCCNFLLSLLYLSFTFTCWFYFGNKSPNQYQKKVFEMIVTFLMSKIVILELAYQVSVMDEWQWTFWLVLIAWAKGLTYHGNFYVYYISQCGENCWSQYFFPFFHIVPVLFCLYLAITMAGIWTEKVSSKNLIILLWYDIIILFVESGHVVIKFLIHLIDSIMPPSKQFNVPGVLSLLEIFCELILTTLSLLHLFHIITLNGINVTLVGAATIVNLYSVITTLWKHFCQLRKYFLIKHQVESLYPNSILHKTDSFNPSNVICPICLQEYQIHLAMKQLPCSHLIHENCLRTLLQNHTNRLPHEEETQLTRGGGAGGERGEGEVSLPNLSSFEIKIFRCPICRQKINVDTGELIVLPSQPQPQSQSQPQLARDSLEKSSQVEEQEIEMNKSSDGIEPQLSEEGSASGNEEKSHEEKECTPQPQQIQQRPENNRLFMPRMPSSLWVALENTLLSFGGIVFQDQRPVEIAVEEGEEEDSQRIHTFQSEDVDKILEMFPQFPRDMIDRDLHRTSSPNETIENILSGRIQIFEDR